MKPSQADMLLRIAENTYADGDEVMSRMAEMRKQLNEHARRILEDEALLTKAWELNQQDKGRFIQYMPQEYQQTRRVENRTTASAVTQIKKVENNG